MSPFWFQEPKWFLEPCHSCIKSKCYPLSKKLVSRASKVMLPAFNKVEDFFDFKFNDISKLKRV